VFGEGDGTRQVELEGSASRDISCPKEICLNLTRDGTGHEGGIDQGMKF